ncbi:hypothetical protein [Streptomyces sp. DH8]|uniref:hypothetical protein n=1 Tax=Streptomyces sp. DH8 TaxID=2857008 RepID=UPI0027DEF521|nr:hypothetical protein [Streptomyces sp. DH8]
MGGVTAGGQPDDGSGRLWPPAGPAGPVGSLGPVGPVGPVGVPGMTGGPGPGAAGGGDLRHSRGPWLRAADGAEQLVTHLGPVRAELGSAHRGLAAGGQTLSALAELGVVRASWERRIDQARGECGSLAGNMRAAVQGQARSNDAVRSGFDSVKTPSVTPPGTPSVTPSGGGAR